MNLIIISGPTASGKSAIAMEVAEKFNGEIISADSMQLYKGLDIGTAKPSAEEKKKVPHHLIDTFDISERLDVFKYIELAKSAICEIHSRNKIPMLVGGTGLYIRALLYGLDPMPADPALRANIDHEFDNPDGISKLKLIMEEKDIEDYERWKEHPRKLLRAYEVFLLTGSSITELQKTWKSQSRPKYEGLLSFTILPDRTILKQRIHDRTDKMLSSGWIDEAQGMIKAGLLTSPTAHQALGYATIGEYLDGKLDFETMRSKIVTATWQLARRQETWFKKQHPETRIIDADRIPAEISKREFDIR